MKFIIDNKILNKSIKEKMESKLKPEFIEKIRQIEKQKSIRIKDFAKKYGLS
ncbi:MAG TPA: hypothetical protein VJJ23_06235 [Candidatus Nanoarchaeia archaeon]|nr:hypothetical protein [Candidatus Nanoarchaeia archaeon]